MIEDSLNLVEWLSSTEGQKLIAKIMKKVHIPHWSRTMPKDWNPDIPSVYYEETNFHGKPYEVPVVILRTNPCLWFVEGGCIMCNYMIEAANDKSISRKNILNQIDWIIDNFDDLSNYQYLVVTTAGSFLSSYEIDKETQLTVLKNLHDAGLHTISFESEAKYCTNYSHLQNIKNAFEGDISIGVGLESSNDYIRNVCLNKGLSSDTFDLSIEIMNSVGISFYNYVLLGKPFLTPLEDIKDAISSIRFAIDKGAQMIVMLLVNIQPHTLTHWLWERGLYKPPSLWNAIEVLKSLPSNYRNRVAVKGIDKAIPNPLVFGQGCSACSDRLLDVLRSWNLHRNFEELCKGSGTCTCYANMNLHVVPSDDYRTRISSRLREITQNLGLE